MAKCPRAGCPQWNLCNELNMNLNLQDKRVLITGGSHGIGKEIALSLAREKCKIAICSRGSDKIAVALKEIQQYDPEALGFKCDVLNKEDINKTISSLTQLWGGVHILINNVGGGGRWGDYDILKTPERVWDEVYDKNVVAARRFTLGFLPWMMEQKWGRVITISSISGLQCHERPWFGIAKHSEIYLMKSFARRKEYARSGITFNTVTPGSIMIEDTGWHKEKLEDPIKFQQTFENLPLGRPGLPEEVAYIVTFMCSDRSSLLNGSCITVDGGESVYVN